LARGADRFGRSPKNQGVALAWENRPAFGRRNHKSQFGIHQENITHPYRKETFHETKLICCRSRRLPVGFDGRRLGATTIDATIDHILGCLAGRSTTRKCKRRFDHTTGRRGEHIAVPNDGHNDEHSGGRTGGFTTWKCKRPYLLYRSPCKFPQ
jgi:hypothetical protein